MGKLKTNTFNFTNARFFLSINMFRQIDIVILNAATFGIPWTVTKDGLETTFQVNFLSQYYLLLCLGKMLAPDARVVFTSSESHRYNRCSAPLVIVRNIIFSGSI